MLHLVAHHNFSEEQLELLQRVYPMKPDPAQITGRAVLPGAAVQIPDILTDAAYPSAALGNKARSRMCPAYVAGLIGSGDRKSIQPMAARDGQVGYDQLHHFIASGAWNAVPLEKVLLAEADKMVGSDDAWLIIDDTALPKKGERSVGVAPQYASSLGKTANCQSLVSMTLASREVPMMVGLRLFLPETWTDDPERMTRAHVPKDRQTALPWFCCSISNMNDLFICYHSS